jgi:hypothetical protein
MKRIARQEGAATDTARDYVSSDWDTLDAFAREFATGIAPVPRSVPQRLPAQDSPRP